MRSTIRDDGSLSWFAQVVAKQPYMIIEVQHGQPARNARMIRRGVEVFHEVHGF